MEMDKLLKMGRYMLTRRKLFSDDEFSRYAIDRILNSCSALEYESMIEKSFGFSQFESSRYVFVESRSEIHSETSEPLSYRSIVIFHNELGMRLFLFESRKEDLTYEIYSMLVN